MPMRAINSTEELGLARGAAAVCVWMYPGLGERSAREGQVECLRAALRGLDAETTVLVLADRSECELIAARCAAELHGLNVLSLPCETTGAMTPAINAAVALAAPADVALLSGAVWVEEGWLARLRAAASSDSTVASATPFSLGGGGVELDGLADDAPRAGAEVARHAQALAANSLRMRPRIAVVGPGCAYLRRAALELAGALDERLAPDEALAALAGTLSACGLLHVAADDVLVGGPGGGDERGASAVRRDVDAVELTLGEDERGALRRAMRAAAAPLRTLSVTIDGRALTATIGGTQTYIVELVLALARESETRVRVLVPPDLSARAAEALTAAQVELLSYEQAVAGAPRTDVVHRPQSVFTPDDMVLLRLLGDRVIVGQLDLIAYHNPSYHEDVEHWRAYRRTTREALGAADQVVFFSEHARRDALGEDLLPVARAHHVGIGSDPLEVSIDAAAEPPPGLRGGERFLLCLGADYAHKNRLFAIELLAALGELGWDGRLVLAGAHVPFGSSRERERELLAARPGLAARVLDLGPVAEPAKAWLYSNAAALLYPTVYEGFGLLPLEAARWGLPCLFAAQASLSELAGEAASLVAWDAHASAEACLALLGDGPERERHLDRLRALAIPLWSEVAAAMLAVYEHAVTAPPAEGSSHIWQELERERHIVALDGDIQKLKGTAQEYQDAYHALEARVSAGLPLVDEGGLLSRAQQRGLMRLASRRVGALLLGPLAVLGRAGTGGEERPDGDGEGR